MYQENTDIRLLGKLDVRAENQIPVPATLKENSANHEKRRERRSSDIAIIGLSGRFAGSANLEELWSHLQAGESCIEPIRRVGWEMSENSDPGPERSSTSQVKWGGLLEHIDQFDPLFFNISPLEAAKMDPQQRLFLEEAYKAFEDAGYCAEQLSEKKVGVFVGARPSDYKEQALHNYRDSLSEIDAHLFLGNDMAILAARISYFLNCKGPSLTIDTASSSSLVAIHLACESIRTGESEMALAGGVFVMSSSEYYLMAAKTQMLSPDGKCKTFDKSANGIVLGEGVGALVLKPLDAAIEDGDHLYGVILGSALNQDGRTKGMTAPSLLSQKALLSDLYKKAEISPETVSYIEAHGTGSKLGDPIEVQALTEAFQIFTAKKQFCAIGSHKPIIGHTISSAGIAGVLKILLAMKYQQIPPTLNVEEVNPQIDFQGSPFFLNTELREWKSRDGSPRRAGVSSFGLSGTNCHVILEEPPPNKKQAQEQTRPYYFFPFSAKTKAALSQKVVDMVNWLEKEGEKYAVEDISYTLVQGRSHFAVRSALVARDTHELLHALRAILSNGGSEQNVQNEKGHSSQTEPLLQAYGDWLLQELLENTSFVQEEYKEKLAILADFYVKGYSLDWGKVFKKGRYSRVPLPTYPFLGASYWIAENRRDSALCLSEQPSHVPTDRLREALSHMVSRLLKVRVEEIDAETPLSEYGFDSITFTEFANRLNQTYQLDLTPALFFEYLTLVRLAQYLYATYAPVLAPYFTSVSPAVMADEVPPASSIIQQRTHVGSSAMPLTPPTAEPIAIIGMSGIFPLAPDVQSLWSNLLAGRDCIGEIPASRWDWQTSFGNPATPNPNKTNIKWAGIVEDVELFDPQFFGISPREAEQMDPQQRLLMIYVWKAIEDAGYAASSLSGTNTALFVGTTSSGYSERLSRAGVVIEGYSSTGQAASVGPNRMSYFLNLHGPSEAIDTACSSSLVAIHRGVNAIESGQCTMAIVGGVNTLISPELHISYSKAGMLCEDGRCKTFSAQANGYVRGEGVGILVLKKLSDAEQAGNHIYGVIRGSAENHGGRAASLTAPNPRAQADLLIAAYHKAGIDPRTVGYIEAHGTGTALGDPIEINGLKTAFSELDPNSMGVEPIPQAWCGIGSLKSNIGHLELAAGVAGVIKVLLQLQHKKLVKSLHCEQINPYIQLEGGPFYIVQENREWEVLRDSSGNALPRRAGVSSFGFGGANAHVVFEEYVPMPIAAQSGSGTSPRAIIVLSARNEERLHEQVRQLLAWVKAGTYTEEYMEEGQDRREALQDLAYTLQVGREAMEERLALQVGSLQELEEKLRGYVEGRQKESGWYRGQAKRHDTVGGFAEDEGGRKAVAAWISKGKYGKLLKFWVKGGTIDWKLLYTIEAGSEPTAPALLPRRISLPTYPFARQRYWFPIETSQTILAPTNRVVLRSLGNPMISQSGSNDVVAPVQMPEEPRSHSGQGQALSTVPWLEEELTRSLAQALYMEESAIDVEKPFGDMGLDSVVGVEWIQSLNKQYAGNLKVNCVYDYPTIRQLAGFLEKDLLKHRGGIQQTPAQSMSTPSLDDLLEPVGKQTGASPIPTAPVHVPTAPDQRQQQVQQGNLETEVVQANHAQETGRKEAIAIVGISGKYPDARDLTEYWANLVQAKNSIREIPLSRWDLLDYYDQSPAASGKMYCKWLGALDEIEYFDPLFFHISPAEAEAMDPQHRLFLEEGYKAFADAGYSPKLLSSKKCGVYLGIMSHEYALLLHEYNTAETHILGTSPAIAAARIAYLLNLKGPALAIDTACSSSLVATHLACQALSNQEIDMALVGGVSLYLTPGFYVGMCNAGMLSPSGQCKTFDASANGFVPGEGVGALVLKRLQDAEADHDQIYGVIIASGMNQDGATNGITAPNVQSQIDLVREIYEKYQIEPESISYAEMHGTGTKLGDLIELEALATVFQEKTQCKQYCAIGSVKTNIGHTSAAAGMASVQKVLLAMKQKKIVPTLHFEQPNPHFDFVASPFYVNTKVQDWQSAVETPRRAAVSSFGFSGTNAHLIIEEYLPACRDADGDLRDRDGSRGDGASPRPKTPCLFVLSAKSEQQLKSYAQDMKRWIQAYEELAPEDIAFTLQVGREAMDYRLAILASSRKALLQRLEEFIGNHTSTGVYTAQVKRGSTANDAMLFETDEDGQSLLSLWCQKKKLEKIAQVWVRGVNIDWMLLYIGHGRQGQAQPLQYETTPEADNRLTNVGAGLTPAFGFMNALALPHRVSLPPHPFARERYWIPTSTPSAGTGPRSYSPTGSLTATTASPFAALHPLVQRNTSTLREQQFTSTFRGDEFFLTDHVVRGQHIMPGVAYLEMARAAVTLATAEHEVSNLRLSHVVWARPLVCDPAHPVTVHITLEPQESGTISFRISHVIVPCADPGQVQASRDKGQNPTPFGEVPTALEEEETATLIYCQGTADLRAESAIRLMASQSLDLPAIQSRCQHQIPSPSCYRYYRSLGMNYGPALQGIEYLNIGESEVLARLRLPAVVVHTHTEGEHPYMLHPSMLDAALHACVGLLIEQEKHQELQAYVPFALDELEIVSEVPAQGWAWVHQKSNSTTGLVLDVEVCDDMGHVAVRLHGLSIRMLPEAPAGQAQGSVPTMYMKGDTGQAQDSVSTTASLLVGTLEGGKPLPYVPVWNPIVLPQATSSPGDPISQVVIVGGTLDEQRAIAHIYPHTHTLETPTNTSIEKLAQRLQEFGVIEHVFWSAPHDPQQELSQERILLAQQQGVLACFRLIKALLQLGYASKTLCWTVITRQTRTLHATEICDPTHAGLLGLFGSLTKEYSHWWIQQVDLPANTPLPLAEIQGLPADPQGHGWLYRNGHWYRQILVPLNVSSFDTRETYRRGGVYVVIGGAGGIGEVWSEYVIHRYQAQIIWIGRRKTNTDIEAKQERLADLGPKPHYIMADATDRRALRQAYQEIKRNFGQIHGVVHSAIVLLDQSLANMDVERFQAALAAKVEVSVHLAQVFEYEPLDFVLFFSSFNAFARNAGQSNYAAGCTFEDAFAARLRRDWSCAVKGMNWGYWGSVGVVASPQYRERMTQAGLGSIEPAEAMEALEHLLAGPVDQMVFLKTTRLLPPEGELIQAEEMIMGFRTEHIPSGIQLLEHTNAHQYVRREPLAAKTRQGMQEMEELLSQLLWSYLQSLSLFREKHGVLTLLREQAGISTNYDRWLQESIALLEQKLYLHCQNTPTVDRHTTFTISDAPTPIEISTLWQRWNEHKERWMQDADLKVQVVLVETTLRALPAILTGKRPATEILFPYGSMQLVEGIYQHNAVSDYFNDVLATLIVTYLQERLRGDRHARIRLLEVGAGTGGSTSRILQMLQPYQASIAEYCYSDISEAFLSYGQRMYAAEHPYLTFQLFNVEKALAGQSIQLGSYDLVIATNVLHATSNIRRTIRNVKAALKKHGLLLLNEITGTSLFTHLTFGLLPGWWAYEDSELRVPGCPALTTESWEAVLSSEGFGAIHLPTREVQEVGQQVIVAESDGVVRQGQWLAGVTQGTEASPRLGSAQGMGSLPHPGSAQGTIPTADNTYEALREKSVTYLKGLVGKVLNLPSTKIDAAEPLTNYGLDSILVLQLIKTLRVGIEQISSTLFFEYATIDALVEHFLQTQKEALERLVSVSVPAHELGQAPLLQPAQPKDRVSLRGNQRFLTEDHTVRMGTSPVPTATPATRTGTSPVSTETSATMSRGRDIAIIGLAGRYPGAKDMQAFWHLLKAGKSAIGEIPQERWDWRRYFQAEKEATGQAQDSVPTMYTKWGGFLEDIDCFDAAFFHISPRDAEQMDPQERLFLEVSYTCIEDAGYTPAELQAHGPVGVFVGVMNGNYPTGARYWSIANRVSFVLGLRGPSMAIDTACSSSLTALHFAVESLISGTSTCAIVGGVNLIVDPVHYARLSQLGMLSASDQCRSFGENADGFVDGEGVGAILLKPLQRAEADGDHIYGVIKATAINHGGKTNGYTVPNPQAQAEVIEQALHRAAIDSRTISYVEAHGTGTVLGDPIEIDALTRAFVASHPRSEPRTTSAAPGWCAIGSVKSNIGHTESAAGMAGLTKALLQMYYGQLVPSLHAQVLNPLIDFNSTPFVVQQELTEWKRPQVQGVGEGAYSDTTGSEANGDYTHPLPSDSLPRRAGISSFGAGGSNAHVILEEYMPRHRTNEERNAPPSRPAIIILSARTEERLQERVQQLLTWIREQMCDEAPMRQTRNQSETQSLRDLAYTLQVGREAMEERLAMLVSSPQELEDKLCRYVERAHEGGDWHRGQVKRHDAIDIFATDEDGQKTVAAWMSKGKYGKLMEFWARGGTIDWKLLYTAGAGEEPRSGSSPHPGSAQGMTPTSPILPRRISLPTYPFARQRHWFHSGVSPTSEASPMATVKVEPTGSLTALSPIGSVHPQSPEGSPLSTVQQVLPSETEGRSLALTINTNENGKALRVGTVGIGRGDDPEQGSHPAPTNGVVLRPLGNPALPNGANLGSAQDAIPTTHMQMALSAIDPVRMPEEPHHHSGQGDRKGSAVLRIPLSTAPRLEEELARSLANVLHMQQSDIDVETPFLEMGLDSVGGVEWVHFLNKQYASSLTVARIYDYPTISQMASFLEKDLLKHGGGIQQAPAQLVSTLSLDDVLQQVRQGTLDPEKAKQLLQSQEV